MIVYITTNTINGKKYIGKDEKNNPKYLGSGLALRNAIKFYGKENFEKEILAYARDKEDLEDLEKYYIKYYGATKSDLFHNITEGGTGGVTHNQFLRKRAIYQYSLKGNFIEEWKSAGDAAKALCIKRVGILKGIRMKHSYNSYFWSYIKDISIDCSPRIRCKAINQYDINMNIVEVWPYLSKIEEILGFNRANVHKALSGKCRSAYGFIWVYSETSGISDVYRDRIN